jgi:hypothetical protein
MMLHLFLINRFKDSVLLVAPPKPTRALEAGRSDRFLRVVQEAQYVNGAVFVQSQLCYFIFAGFDFYHNYAQTIHVHDCKLANACHVELRQAIAGRQRNAAAYKEQHLEPIFYL